MVYIPGKSLFRRLFVFPTEGRGFQAVTDLLIAGSMIIHLQSARTGFPQFVVIAYPVL